jgi:ribulose kinase
MITSCMAQDLKDYLVWQTTLTVVPAAAVEGAKWIYDVSEDEIQALRQFRT